MERVITVMSDVKDLGELLSGARVEEVRCVPSGSGLQLVVRLTRGMLERQTLVRRGPFRRLTTPWTKCELRLARIAVLTIRRLTNGMPDQLPVFSCEAVPGGYQLTVQAADGQQFVLGTSQLDGTFTDVGSPLEIP